MRPIWVFHDQSSWLTLIMLSDIYIKYKSINDGKFRKETD